jgi:hypothetical protein
LRLECYDAIIWLSFFGKGKRIVGEKRIDILTEVDSDMRKEQKIYLFYKRDKSEKC